MLEEYFWKKKKSILKMFIPFDSVIKLLKMYPKEIIRDTDQNLEPTYMFTIRRLAPTGQLGFPELWFPPLPFAFPVWRPRGSYHLSSHLHCWFRRGQYFSTSVSLTPQGTFQGKWREHYLWRMFLHIWYSAEHMSILKRS